MNMRNIVLDTDNKFVDCAITANAEYIVTEDHHSMNLKIYLSHQLP